MTLLVVLAAAALAALLGICLAVVRPALPRLRHEDEDEEGGLAATMLLFGRPAGRRPVVVGAAPGPAAPPPAVQPAAAPVPAADRRRGQPPVADVLLVTDDASLRMAQHQMLAGRRCTVRDAVDGAGVAEAVRVGIPDLVLVDASACTDTAVTLVRGLRAWPKTETVPIVLLGGDDRTLRGTTADLGVTDVVVGAARVPGLVGRAVPYWLVGAGVFRRG